MGWIWPGVIHLFEECSGNVRRLTQAHTAACVGIDQPKTALHPTQRT